jgi:hypothetical protein
MSGSKVHRNATDRRWELENTGNPPMSLVTDELSREIAACAARECLDEAGHYRLAIKVHKILIDDTSRIFDVVIAPAPGTGHAVATISIRGDIRDTLAAAAEDIVSDGNHRKSLPH